MRVTNEPDDAGGVLAQLFKLQTEFSARMTEETIRYLRRVQGMSAPAAPETVVLPTGDNTITGSAQPGGTASLELELENRQRVHTVVSTTLTAMVAASGVTWFPRTEIAPSMLLVAPDETRSLVITVPIPPEIPVGKYRGAILMPGFTNGGIPVELSITDRGTKKGTTRSRTRTNTTTSTTRSKTNARSTQPPAKPKTSTAGVTRSKKVGGSDSGRGSEKSKKAGGEQ
ncbi:MAG TPA: hypothetical protein VLS86_05825 [Acidimicrobiia bacterium]|nr:hypothetical protein [Acidimicrobiia bacterium]